VSIHRVFQVVFRFTRGRRMRWFSEMLRLHDGQSVLDVGGTDANWQHVKSRPQVVLLNRMLPREPIEIPKWLRYSEGDALDLPYQSDQFDIGFSNSVIEHMGSWENQRRFAEEIRRVGRALWVQTPALGFPIEPHFLAFGVHWLPKSWRKRVLRHFTPWGWLQRPSREEVEATVEEIRLLSYREMCELFPDCEMLVERFLLWPKAYIAVRRDAIPGADTPQSIGAPD